MVVPGILLAATYCRRLLIDILFTLWDADASGVTFGLAEGDGGPVNVLLRLKKAAASEPVLATVRDIRGNSSFSPPIRSP